MPRLLEYLQQTWPAFAAWPISIRYLIVSLILATIVILFVSVLVLFLVWWERKVAGRIQNRYGPTETGGKFGWLQTLADGMKLIVKEDIIPAGADPILFTLAPCIILGSSLALYAAVPFSEKLVVAPIDIGLLWLIAFGSLVVIGILMAGWAQNNKWALFGGMRSAAQIVSYEIPGGLALLTPIALAGTLNLVKLTQMQGSFLKWNVWPWISPFNTVAFLIYFIAALAETNRTPFDLPEAESELVAGYFTEYTGIRFSFFFLAEYSNMFLVSAVASIVFLGGFNGPVLPGPVWLMLKALFLVFVMMLIRWTFPRLRVDQLMSFCWKFLLPLSLACLIGNAAWALI